MTRTHLFNKLLLFYWVKIVLKDSHAGETNEVIFKKLLKAYVFLALSQITYIFQKAGENTDRKDLTYAIFLQVS